MMEFLFFCESNFLTEIGLFPQAMYANTSVATGMKGASKAMAAMNKVWMTSFWMFRPHFFCGELVFAAKEKLLVR